MASIKQRKSSFSVIYWYLDSAGERKQKWDTLETRKEAKQRKAFIEYYQEKFGYVIVPLEEQFAHQIENSKKELDVVDKDIMQKLKEKDILKIFPTQKPHCTTRLVLKTPKTETSNRVVWLPKTVAELLVQYKKDQQELKEFLGSAYNDYNLVIALDNGNPVESRIVRDRFQKLCEENDYEVVVFHSLRHLSTGYKLKMTNGDVKSVQGDTGHAEAEMVTDVYSEIIDEDRRFNAQKMDKEFYSTLNDDTDNPKQDTDLTDSDMALLELIKSLSPEMKEQFLKQALQR